MNHKCIIETLLTDKKHIKLFVMKHVKQSKGCKFMPKMHQIIRPPSHNGGLLLRRGKGKEAIYKGSEEGKGPTLGAEGNSPQSR